MSTAPGSIVRQIVGGSMWMFSLRAVVFSTSLAKILVLARLLTPRDFGIFGIAALTMGAVEALSQTGFSAALIQKQDDIRSHLDTAWTMEVLRGFLLAILLYLMAPLIAGFFNEADAVPIIRTIGIVLVFNGLTNIGVVYFPRELAFHKEFVLRALPAIVGLAVGIVAALHFRNAWALVYAAIATGLVQAVLSYLLHRYRPRPCFDFDKAKELYLFGRWVFLTRIMNFLVGRGDAIVVGRVLGSSALGLYQMAIRISQAPATEIGDMVSMVAFPAFSKIQHDKHLLRATWLKSMQLTTLLTFPLGVVIFIFAPEAVEIVLGEKWLAAVPAVRMLSLLGMIKTLSLGPLFMAVGQPKIITQVASLRLAFLALLIYPLTATFGIVGAGAAVLLAYLLVFGWILRRALALIECTVGEFSRTLSWPAIATTALAFVSLAVKVGLDDGT